MTDYEALTEELQEVGEVPLLYSLGEDDENYFRWLIKNGANIPKNILEQILNNGWDDKYVVLLLKIKPGSYFNNPLKSAILAEKDDIIDLLLNNGFQVDDNVILTVIDEDNTNLLSKLLPLYKGDVNKLYDITLQRAAPASAKFLRDKGAKPVKAKEEDECEKDEEGNIIDPFSSEPIPKERLVSIKEKEKVYCFDLDSLYKNYRSSGKLINPFTNNNLPDNIVKKIQSYGQKNKTLVTFKPNIPAVGFGPKELEMDRDTELGQVLFDFNERSNIGTYRGRQNFGNFMLIIRSDGKAKKISDFDLTTPMNSVKFDKPFEFIVQDLTLDPYRKIKLGELYPRIHKYASGKNIAWAETNLISNIYHQNPPAQERPGANDLKEFADILVDLENPGDIAEYVVDEKQLKILTEDTPILEEIIDSKFKGDENNYLKHILFSRVIDKQNLKARGVEGYYIRNVYELPDWRLIY
jgi:hypothetical protein